MFYEGNKRKQVPSNADPEKLESFFNCAATLMTENLQQLSLNSLDDFTDLICQPPVSIVNMQCTKKLPATTEYNV